MDRWDARLLGLALVFAAAAVLSWKTGFGQFAGPALLVALTLTGVCSHRTVVGRRYSFTIWLVTAAVVALFYPRVFLTWGGFDLKRLIVPCVQVVMFGVGVSVSPADFARALKAPKAVFVGLLLQFTVMPLLGAALAFGFGFEPEIGAGFILLGACSGGVSSNVMSYLARANVALSVTMTCCSTLLSPLMTPVAMEFLAGRLVPIPFLEMLVSILKMVLVPVAGGMIANYLLRGRRRLVDQVLPVVSMATICFVNGVITANSREKLLTIGLLLFLPCVLHNLTGYALGYLGARLAGLSRIDCRTVALEVGMQNGGMATGLAIDVLKSASAALPSAVFGTIHNATGALLASRWRQTPAS